MSMTYFGVFIVRLEHILHLSLVFPVDFEQKMLAKIELLMCNCSENYLKRAPTAPK